MRLLAVVKESDLPTAGYATPSTYMVNGVQYVVISCGGARLGVAKGDYVVAFKLRR
jgi:quinoprotein glucose dehydrogenase